MFLKVNELAQGSKTVGRKPRIFTIDFTFLGPWQTTTCIGGPMLKKKGKKNKRQNTERKSTNNT